MLLAPPPLAAAQELHYLQVEQTGRLAAGEQAMFLATCPEDLKIVAGGYKLVTSELSPLHLVRVENRPVPERRQWAVTLLYEPPKPAVWPAGGVRLEVWVVCTGQATGRPGELSQKRL
jgi:hypothetical protein